MVLGLAFFIFALPAHAATLTWDGGGTTNNWSECANWTTDTCPTSADTAVFDSTSVKNATVDASFGGTIVGLTISTGYTGTITLARSLDIINGAYSQADGAFDLSSQTLTVRGNLTISGGTFTPGTGTVVFRGNNSTIDVPTSLSLYNVDFNTISVSFGITISSGDTLTATNRARFIEGTVGVGTIDVGAGATVYASSTADGGSATVKFAQAGDEVIQCDTSSARLPGLLVAKSSGTLSFNCPSLTISSTTITGGTLAIGTNTLTVVGGFTQTTGTFDAGTGTVVFRGNNSTIDVPTSLSLYNVDFNTISVSFGITISSGDTLTATNRARFIEGTVGVGTIDVGAGATVYASSTADGGSATVQFTHTGDESIICDNNAAMPGILENKSSGTLTYSCSTLTTYSFTLQNGTFSLGSKTFTVSTNFTHTAGGIFDSGTSAVTFSSGGDYRRFYK